MRHGGFVKASIAGKQAEARRFAVLFLLSALTATSGWAKSSSAKPVPKVEMGEVKVVPTHWEDVHPIPYPNGAIYLPRGLAVSFMGGKHRNLGESQSLFQWQGEVGYFYTPFFSGGAGFRIRAGEPSAITQKVENRYFLLTRFHKSWKTVAIFGGPELGLDNLNVLSGAPPKDSLNTVITKPIKNTNAGLGLEAGGGWLFSKWVGFTLGGNMEYSLVGRESNSVANGLNLHVLPGLALDLLSCTHTPRALVHAAYFFVEFQSGLLIFEKKLHKHDVAGVTGISVAF